MPGKFTLKPAHLIRYAFLLFTILIIAIPGLSQKFPASEIPDSLKENADMVIRLDEISYEIKSPGHAICHEHHVYTILNEKGEYYATYRTDYNNKTVIINNIVATMYDASGKEIGHFRKKDMEDHPVNDGSSFVSDERYKKGSLYSHTYPYTVEFEEEDEIEDLFVHIRSWLPQGNPRHSVQKTVYGITAPIDFPVRYKMIHSSLKPLIEEKTNKRTFTWELKNLVAYDDEPYSNMQNITPHLLIGFDQVEMQNYKGRMNTWGEFALFYGSLQKGRDVLPQEARQQVHELTKGLNSPYEKVSVLYHYLQQNTHYVGIQLGIGGWQTYDANYVAANKYGDCKALSNFMIALLKEAGIKGHAVVIYGGTEKADFVSDFTNDPFNHVICCVPLDKDTLWLECTSQSLPAGYLSEFTSNRYGLFIDDEGGSLVHTPAYLLPDNTQIRKIKAVLDQDGNLNLDVKTSYRAICQDEVEAIIHHESKEDQLKRLKSDFDLPTYEVVSFNYLEDYSKRLPVITETIHMTVGNYAQVTGKRIFINPNILSRMQEKAGQHKDRQLNIEIKDEFKHVDSVEIEIPAGYEIESKSIKISIDNKFGKYLANTTIAEDKIKFIRIREQISGCFPPKDYDGMVKYLNDIYETDHSSIVLAKKN